ncbi:sterol carrier family protein [Pseudooceanicola batsensis HTCC2597]|uniref:Sterol carrier family protein n=1 Tax=Pseudooceanicola batsensis (strain ATCC BAA-863 / DSM 15984 / KCTC 12145 / HTCC2597) TaxID=252305 RepID=A3TX15_PSEBH|nr:SCP2 sterol-binding domain-containing protein [Pseudooceanicola batsensis]EAQ03375.1 sterol carrier family protein [Pseudooceanicola batsensis HTCC2597]
MSEVINGAVAALREKMSGSFDGTAKFVIEGEGAIMIEGDEVRPGDEEADVTMTADTETFQEILSGELNPTSAFMSGKLSVDGDMGKAMSLGSMLS